MKKLIMAAAIVCAAALVQAATVGWTALGLASVSGTAKGASYQMFVYNTAAEGADFAGYMGSVISSLDKGENVTSFANGTIPTSGSLSVAAKSSGKELGEGTWQSFMVLFDSATPVGGESKYLIASGAANQTKQVTGSTASVSFAAGNLSELVSSSANWKSFGSAGPGPGPDVPEPTSGLLLLLGMAGLALKRKVA